MKKQDIAALIDGKIKGQGSAIDIGGALPEILGGLNENSVSEDMDEDAQMQMRKKLGLYYEETGIIEKTTEVYSGTPAVDYRQVSSDAPAMEDIVGVILNPDGGAATNIPVSELTLEWQTENECYDIKHVTEWELTLFTVVLVNGYGGLPAGIFASVDTENFNQQLVYNASETVISKVPEKFLPAIGEEVEGNPEVPQGTSPTPLETMRINDDYFSIPQGSGGTPVTLLQIPSATGPIIISDYLSDADVQRLKDGETCVATNAERTQYWLVAVRFSTDSYAMTYFTFYGEDGWSFYLVFGAIENRAYLNSRNTIEITDFPASTMTSEEIKAVGFTDNVFLYAMIDNYKQVKVGGMFAQEICSIIYLSSTKLEFWSDTNKYVVTYTVGTGTLACTVTAR